MLHAYAENYLNHARNNLGQMLEAAVYQFKCPLAEFYQKFLSSPVSLRFGGGEPDVLVGHSGLELVCEVLPDKVGMLPLKHRHILWKRTPEYWTGWALAYFQWQCGWSFREIDSFAPVEQVCSLYHPYHEMDIKHFVAVLGQWYREKHPEARLKRIRMAAGLSQAQLASASGVPLRTIQQYEQFQKDINVARGNALLALATALHCDPAQLLEAPFREACPQA